MRCSVEPTIGVMVGSCVNRIFEFVVLRQGFSLAMEPSPLNAARLAHPLWIAESFDHEPLAATGVNGGSARLMSSCSPPR